MLLHCFLGVMPMLQGILVPQRRTGRAAAVRHCRSLAGRTLAGLGSAAGSLAGNLKIRVTFFRNVEKFSSKSGYFIPVVLVKKRGMQPPESINENGCTLDHLDFVGTRNHSQEFWIRGKNSCVTDR